MALKFGGVNAYTVQESSNTGLGQGGSVFIDTADQDITPPSGRVFVAVTIITAAKFNELEATAPDMYISTSGTASTTGPPGYLIDNSNEFPAGITIFGRWDKIDIDAGAVIAYLGK
jgi:hypothetical protein